MIDVSDIVLDADMGGFSFDVIRRERAVGANGMAALQPAYNVIQGIRTTARGVIVSGNVRELERDPEGARQVSTLSVHTPFRLTSGTDQYEADIVWWQNRSYTVVLVNDYSHYGRGFVNAIIELLPINDAAGVEPQV